MVFAAHSHPLARLARLSTLPARAQDVITRRRGLVKASFIGDLDNVRAKFLALAEGSRRTEANRGRWTASGRCPKSHARGDGRRWLHPELVRREARGYLARRWLLRTLSDKAGHRAPEKGFAHAKKELEALDAATPTETQDHDLAQPAAVTDTRSVGGDLHASRPDDCLRAHEQDCSAVE
jgi:hypothetical protein